MIADSVNGIIILTVIKTEINCAPVEKRMIVEKYLMMTTRAVVGMEPVRSLSCASIYLPLVRVGLRRFELENRLSGGVARRILEPIASFSVLRDSALIDLILRSAPPYSPCQ